MSRFLLPVLFLGACAMPAAEPVEGAAERLACAKHAPIETAGWKKLGVVRGLPEPVAAGDGILAPAVVVEEGALRLWYTQKVGSRHVLMHGVSHDGGESFSAPVPVLGLGEERMNAYPSVWREDGTYRLLFGGGSIRQATSTDGIRFDVAPSSALSPSFEDGRFDALSVLYPSRVPAGAADEPAVVFFTGYDGTRVRIGRAVEQPGTGGFVADPPHPVVDIGAPADFDNAAVAQAHVHRAGGQWVMWYGGYDTSHSSPGPYRIGSATSADGVVWKKHGVVLDLGTSGSDAWSTRDPVVVRSAPAPVDGWTMFYVGLGDDGRYRLHRAASACPR